MKKITLLLSLVFLGAFAHAQNWLENVLVEIYYISDANDSTIFATSSGESGTLPVGTVTYRVYADMLPGYKFESAYGNIPHPLSIITSTKFFNDENRGATTPIFTKTQARGYSAMLDSWVSAGAGCANNFGVLKSDDDGVATVVNANSMLQSMNPLAGIPVMTQDGLLGGTIQNPTPQAVTIVGIPNSINGDLSVFDATNQFGDSLVTNNGAWASLNGSYGINPDTNRVLIAQITTDGQLCFKLNLQIGDSTGGTQNYVWSNPTGNEITIPSLTYCSFITDITNPQNSSTPSLFLAYPNPVKNTLAIKVIAAKPSTENSYTIYDTKGTVVFHKELGAIQEKYFESLDVSSLSKGEYIIELFLDGMSSSQKVVIN